MTDPTPDGGLVFVLVGGWPGSGKSTLARSLAQELRLPLLMKDEVKESLMTVLGAPIDVPTSRDLGRAAVAAVLTVARSCPSGAVVDSTWFAYARPWVEALPGPCVEVRCALDRATAERRYRARQRDPRHLDDLRTPEELWGEPVQPLGVGPLVEVDTSGSVDIAALAIRIHAAAG